MTRSKAQKSTPSTRAISKLARSQAYHKPDIHPGRTSIHWKCTAFISGSHVDDGGLFVREEDVYDFKIDFTDTSNARHHSDMKVSLLDIARPAKQRGAAKDFEVVRKVRNVISLEDKFEGLEYYWDSEDDDWEQICDQRHATTEKKSYSSVLKGNSSP